MKVDFSKNKNGFTLIELLVVISIIGVLSSTVMVAVQDARNKANDKALLASAIQLRNALELYKEDHGGLYPGELELSKTTGGLISVYGQTSSSGVFTGYDSSGSVITYNNFVTALEPYLKTKIFNPIYSNSIYKYYSNPNPQINGLLPVKCFGQTNFPRYVFYIYTQTDLGLPGYTVNGTTSNKYSTLLSKYIQCFSSPE